MLRSVPKLLKFKARFPFFVRQVSKKRLECVHVGKVSHPKGSQNGPKMTLVYKLILNDGKRLEALASRWTLCLWLACDLGAIGGGPGGGGKLGALGSDLGG
jgi:hypothetical protein